MKIIFLDIDGVLNGWDLSEYFIYKLWRLIPVKTVKYFIKTKLSHYTSIDKKRVKRLSTICKNTGAKIVLSSSWRGGLLNQQGIRDYHSDRNKLFWNLIDKYHIEVIDKTPRLKSSSKREDEIKAWLSEHSEVDNFIILDDEDADLQCFVGNHLVKTSYKCFVNEYSGLSKVHVKQSIKLLNTNKNNFNKEDYYYEDNWMGKKRKRC